MAWPFGNARPTSTAPRPEQVARPRALTAAGQRVTIQTARLVGARRPDWQRANWSYRTCVPEVRFAGSFVASQIGRVRWFAAEDPGDGGEPRALPQDGDQPDPDAPQSRVSDTTRRVAQQGLARLDLNRRGASMAGRLAENNEYAGEAYLLGTVDPQTGEESWSIRSVSEVRVQSDGTVRLIEPGRTAEGRQLDLEQVALFRLWNPDPEFHDWADAKMQACGGTLEEILLYDRGRRAAARSRIARGAMLFIPSELSITPAGSAPASAELPEPGDDLDEDDDRDDQNVDVFMEHLAAAWREPVHNEEAPEALIPIVLRGNAMAPDGVTPMKDVIGVVAVPHEEVADVIEKRAAAVQALAHGIDFPEERLTGMGKTNHWNGAVISDSEVKNHIEPRCEMIADSLTASFLRSYCLAHDCPPDEVRWLCVWFDASELSQPADPWARAKEAHAAGALSDDGLLAAGDFDPADGADDAEKLLRAMRAGTLPPDLVPVVVALSELDDEQRGQLEQAMGQMAQLAAVRAVSARPGGAEPADVAGGRVIDAPSTRSGTTGRPASTVAPVTTSGPRVSLTAAAARKGPADDPEGPSVAGVALIDPTTGRVLMLQRGLDDDTDPAAGTWEFPGGHVEPGDETSLHAGMREWAEEVGRPFPDGGTVAHTWTSANGVYQGHVVLLPGAEGLVDLDGPRTVTNADDDYSEQSAWWDLDMARRMGPALRPEVKAGTPWAAVKRAVEQHGAITAAGQVLHSTVTAAAPPGRHFRVDERLCRELGAIDQQLVAELGGYIDAQIARTVEQAANRIRNGAIRASASPHERAMFPKGADAVAVVAAAGGRFPWSITDQQALDGALDRIHTRWTAAIARAVKRLVRIIADLLRADPSPKLADDLVRRAEQAWPQLAARIETTTLDVLHGRVDDNPLEPPTVRDPEPARTPATPDVEPVGDDDGSDADEHLLPRDAITEALTDTGGRADTVDTPGPATGLAAGTAVRDTVAEHGGAGLGYEWQWFSHPRDPFPPHLDLSGARFSGFDDDKLRIRPGDGWIGRDWYSPGDHKGCGCSTYIIWATPADPDEPRSAADSMLTDTEKQARTRALAEDDDAHPGRGTLPGGQTHAQRDRDRIDELRWHREQHITDREAV